MDESDTNGRDEHDVTDAPALAGEDEREEWWRIWESCSDIVAATFPYEHLWMAWACWIRAEERNPQPTQCSQGTCMCFVEEVAALEHWRGQRDDFEKAGIDPRAGFAAPTEKGTCPAGSAKDDATLRMLFGAHVYGSDGPITLPGEHALRHPRGCSKGKHCTREDADKHSWYVKPALHRPSNGAQLTTVTIDWRWSNESIAEAIAGLRKLVGTQPESRRGGAPFWNRYGAAKAMALHDLRAAGDSVRAWAAEEARRRGCDSENERIQAQKVLKKIDRAIDEAADGSLLSVLGW